MSFFRFFVLVILVCLSTLVGFAQDKSESIYPPVAESILPTIIVQNDSPLKVESFGVEYGDYGEIQTYYSVRNVSDKPVAAYRVARWFSNNSGFVGPGTLPDKAKFLRPGEVAGRSRTEPTISSRQLQETSKKEIKFFVFILIVEVDFADGTRYTAEPLFHAMEKHLELFEWVYARPSRD